MQAEYYDGLLALFDDTVKEATKLGLKNESGIYARIYYGPTKLKRDLYAGAGNSSLRFTNPPEKQDFCDSIAQMLEKLRAECPGKVSVWVQTLAHGGSLILSGFSFRMETDTDGDESKGEIDGNPVNVALKALVDGNGELRGMVIDLTDRLVNVTKALTEVVSRRSDHTDNLLEMRGTFKQMLDAPANPPSPMDAAMAQAFVTFADRMSRVAEAKATQKAGLNGWQDIFNRAENGDLSPDEMEALQKRMASFILKSSGGSANE